MNSLGIVSVAILYLAFLFGLANLAERRSVSAKSWVNNPYVYALSLAVYCTAWTFYGSVGHAVKNGPDFLAVYIGPTMLIPLWWVVFRKIIRICKAERITNIADFVSARYGKDRALGIIVTILCVVGLMPYISIQLKAIANSFNVLIDSGNDGKLAGSFLTDKAFYMAIVLAVFTILFGARKLEATERHEGMVAVIAFESLIKLSAFLAVGLFVTFGVFNGFSDISQQAAKLPALQNLFTIPADQTGNWFWHCLLSGLAIMFLPRQFQLAIVENINENHLKKAIWLFPLYLLVINIFVLPIAMSGYLVFGNSVSADNYVLALPLHFGQQSLAIFTYLGGFSAASGMIIVECTALTVMISNNLVMPFIVKRTNWERWVGSSVSQWVINLRRISILLLIGLSYLYYRFVSDRYSLVSVGLVSFAAVAQLAPVVIGGIFWKRATREGATGALLFGGAVWFYTLIVPSIVSAGFLPMSLLQNGPFGETWLRPEALFGMTGLDSLSHGLFWSLLVNVTFYVYGSLFYVQTAQEKNQARLFVDIFREAKSADGAVAWRGKVLIKDVQNLLNSFFGQARANRLLSLFVRRNGLDLQRPYADPRLVTYTEKLLGGAVGTASARTLVASVAKEERITTDEVIDILKTSQQLKNLNRELQRKTEELEKVGDELKQTNERLQQTDRLKDDFLSTVTHEIRTPLTSIRALSEIVHDYPDLDRQERQHFLGTIIKDTERLSRLINQVLDLERYDAGLYRLHYEAFSPRELINEAVGSLQQLARERQVAIKHTPQHYLPEITADRDRMMQVLVNLLSNALKFTAPEKGMIALDTFVEEDFIYFRVTDNGTGIDPKFQSLIFDKFYQAHDQTTRKPKGSGLGLAICRRIIELHGGSIWVISKVGDGATFTFKIPIQQPINQLTNADTP
jgi:signal transduction histidine kinase/Na+/proline symporter